MFVAALQTPMHAVVVFADAAHARHGGLPVPPLTLRLFLFGRSRDVAVAVPSTMTRGLDEQAAAMLSFMRVAPANFRSLAFVGAPVKAPFAAQLADAFVRDRGCHLYVRRFAVCHHVLVPESLLALSGAMAEMTALRTLELRDTMTGIQSVNILRPVFDAVRGSLRVLDLSENFINLGAVKDFAPMLAELRQLRRLLLRKSTVFDGALGPLLAALLQLKHLAHLDLSDNRFTDVGDAQLASVLPLMPALRLLDLRLNKSQFAAVGAVMPGLGMMTPLPAGTTVEGHFAQSLWAKFAAQ
jgi:hypothetical protein